MSLINYPRPERNLKDLQTYPITILLVDDQPIIAEAVRSMLFEEKNIIFHYCQEPEKALQKAHEVHPTIILQDLVMPDIDGLTLLRYFQADPETCNIPVIVLSTKEDPIIKANAFAVGAADYIVKLPDKVEFMARICHHSEAYIRLLERNEAYAKLLESKALLNADLLNAALYVTSLLPAQLTGEIEAMWRFLPSKQLGGDAFGYHWLDENHFVLYLLDVCGHGVGAALLSVTIANIIGSQAMHNTDFYNPAQVLANLNEMFPMERHNNMFFTIWYGVYNKTNRQLTYSSGGHPPVLLYNLDSDCQNPIQLHTDGIVIGAIPDTTYVNGSCEIPVNNRLFLYSDGVYEIKKSDGQMTTLEEFKKNLYDYVTIYHNELDQLIRATQKIQNGETNFYDDFSIIEFTFHKLS